MSEYEAKELLDKLEVASLKAEHYEWLVRNQGRWTWQPPKYNKNMVSGFSADITSYLGYTFEQALAVAIQKDKS